MSTPQPRILRDSTLYFLGNVANRIVSFIMMPFYTGHLSPAQYGILNLIELSMTVIAIVFGLQSIGQTMTRRYHDQTDDAGRNTVISTALLGTIFMACCVSLLAVALAHPIALAINLPDQVSLLRAAFVAMIFATVNEVVLVHMRMRNRARFYVLYSLVTLMGAISMNILFIGVYHFGVWGFVSTKFIVSGGGSLFLTTLALREVGWRFSRAHARAMLRFGAPLIASSFGFYSIHFSDRLFLAHVSQADVGIYSLAYNFAFLLSVLVGDSFAKSWGVSFYGLASGEGWQKRFAYVAFWLIFVLGSAAAGISLLGRDTLRVIVPQSYLPPLLMMPVLVFGYFFREVGDFFSNMLLIGHGSSRVGRVAMAGAAFNIALNWLLIAGPLHWGIWGAAIATAVTWIVYCVASWILAWRLHRIPLGPGGLCILLGIAAACLSAQILVPVRNAYGAVALDAGWCLIFVGLTALLYLNRPAREEVLALGGKLLLQARRMLPA